jgi:hypothetical protein
MQPNLQILTCYAIIQSSILYTIIQRHIWKLCSTELQITWAYYKQTKKHELPQLFLRKKASAQRC